MIMLLYLYILAVAVFVGIFFLASLVLLKKSLPTDNASQTVLFFSLVIGVILFLSLVSIFSQEWSTSVSLGGILL